MNALITAIGTQYRTISGLYPQVAGLFFDEVPSGQAFPFCVLYQPHVEISYLFIPPSGGAIPRLEEGEYQFTIRGVGAANVGAYLRLLWTGFNVMTFAVSGANEYRTMPLDYRCYGTGLRDGTGQPITEGIARIRFDIAT